MNYIGQQKIKILNISQSSSLSWNDLLAGHIGSSLLVTVGREADG